MKEKVTFVAIDEIGDALETLKDKIFSTFAVSREKIEKGKVVDPKYIRGMAAPLLQCLCLRDTTIAAGYQLSIPFFDRLDSSFAKNLPFYVVNFNVLSEKEVEDTLNHLFNFEKFNISTTEYAKKFAGSKFFFFF